MDVIKFNMGREPIIYRIIIHKRTTNNKGNEQSRSITLKDYSKKSNIDSIKKMLIKLLEKIK